MQNTKRQNHICFGMGTIGRDMVITLVSQYLIFYLTDILELDNATMWAITSIVLFARIFDAVNDPVMGMIVDNTDTKWGKFKPWILSGSLGLGVLTILLFTDFGLRGTWFIVLFAVLYLLQGIATTMNDLGFWSMLPSLSMDQKEREKIGSFARICANIGMFTVVAGIVPITQALGQMTGSMIQAYQIFAMAAVAIMLLAQSITLFGVKEKRGIFKKERSTTLKDMVSAIFKNDQLMVTTIAMVLFMVGYVTTTGFGLYFFKYVYGDEGMYAVFALVLGVSQISTLAVFPLLTGRFTRRALYSGSTLLLLLGYAAFFFSPMNMIYIGISGIMVFVGQAFIQILMLMFLTDTVEYGQWKLGKRNESVTFALQPFINKLGGALANTIVGAVIITSGINDAKSAVDVTAEGLLMMKTAMLVFPPILIIAGYLVYRKWHRIDAAFYDRMVSDLREKGNLKLDPPPNRINKSK
ncbi:MAG: MFS transporter [Proteobacteria bacterium]|nr:MFS transporter [Pseudomonadota bacterium]